MKIRRPKIGVLLICPPRFRDAGVGTEHGTYEERKLITSKDILSKFDYADVTYTGISYNKEDCEKAILEFKHNEVDMVFAHFLSWSDDFNWIRFLRDMDEVPVLFATIVRDKLGFENSFTEDTFTEFLSAGGLVGSLEASGSLTRLHKNNVIRKVGSAKEIFDFTKKMAKVAALRGELRHNAIGLLPTFNEAMWSTYVDPYDIFTKVGPEIHFLTLAELNEIIDSISDEKCDAVTKEILGKYKAHGEVDKVKMSASVKGSLALEEIARKHGCELLVLNDIDRALLRSVGLRPGFTPTPGCDDVLVVPEGDIGAGLATYFLKKMSDGNNTSFIEPFHIDASNGTFAAGHAGPNDYTDLKGDTEIKTDTRFAKSNFKYAGAPVAIHVFSPGEKTMVHISENNGKFKLVCTLVDVIKTPQFLDGYTHGLFKPRIPVNEFFEKLINIGVTQHYAITAGDYREEMKLLAQFLNMDYYEI